MDRKNCTVLSIHFFSYKMLENPYCYFGRTPHTRPEFPKVTTEIFIEFSAQLNYRIPLTRNSNVFGMSKIDFTPLAITATGFRPNSTKSAETSMVTLPSRWTPPSKLFQLFTLWYYSCTPWITYTASSEYINSDHFGYNQCTSHGCTTIHLLTHNVRHVASRYLYCFDRLLSSQLN